MQSKALLEDTLDWKDMIDNEKIKEEMGPMGRRMTEEAPSRVPRRIKQDLTDEDPPEIRFKGFAPAPVREEQGLALPMNKGKRKNAKPPFTRETILDGLAYDEPLTINWIEKEKKLPKSTRARALEGSKPWKG